jgi:hypothetical protein
MSVKSRRAYRDLPPTWEHEEPTRDTIRVKWVRTDWYWGPECPYDPSHGCLVDIQGQDNWYCRHQSHDSDGRRAVFSEDDLREAAWRSYLASRGDASAS